MSEKITRRLFSIFAASLLALSPLFAADYSPLLGKWSMVSETEDNSLPWTLVLKEADGKLTASLAIDQGEMPVKTVTFSDGVLKFKAPYQGEDYDIELKLTDDKLVGTWSGGGNSGKTTGTRG